MSKLQKKDKGEQFFHEFVCKKIFFGIKFKDKFQKNARKTLKFFLFLFFMEKKILFRFIFENILEIYLMNFH